MVGILLVAHNGLGDSLVDCVRHVLGSTPPNLRVLTVLARDDPKSKEEEARALIAQLDSGDGVLLLTDLFGSTPSNIARRLNQPGKVEGVSGVNLPMLLRAVSCSSGTLEEVVQKALDAGRGCIVVEGDNSGNCDLVTGRTNH